MRIDQRTENGRSTKNLETAHVRSPIKWVGGKSRVARRIVASFPPHTTYVEPFFGGGSILFAKEPSPVEVVNDTNNFLVTFWKVLRDGRRRRVLEKRLENHLISRTLFNDYRKSSWEGLGDVEVAARYYFMVMTSFSGNASCPDRASWSVSAVSRSSFAQFYRTDWKAVSGRLRYVTIESLDFARVIERYDRPGTLFYCDPPYPLDTTRPYYMGNFTEDDHRRLAASLASIKGKCVLSISDRPLVRELYPSGAGFRIERIMVPYSAPNANRVGKAARRRAGELLIFNF